MKKLWFMAAILGTNLAVAQQKIDVQAHRGGMALMPENTVPAMINAVKLGARTLELDVVISKDGKVVVSHDAFMSSAFMRKPNGTEISKEEEKQLSLYQMTYDSISRFDAGTKPHPRYPEQVKMKIHRPLLSELIDSVEHYVKVHGLKPVYYNIETKSSPAGDGFYNPSPDVFVRTMMAVINSKNIKGRVTIQSFDIRTLQVLHKEEPKATLSLLVSGKMNISEEELKKYGLSAKEIAEYMKQKEQNRGGLDEEIKRLGFVPNIYSPYYSGVDAELVKKAHGMKMQIVPWTVNKEEDMVALDKLGVDGIISDYPDKLIKLFGNYQKK
ncbi:glycerophosphodiester phosphodiesterase family protein [Pedobacter ureilyticus]|nr:glycerophosphodiester phosphodiesterase family protein [Pedobacter helvus]